MRLKPKLDVFHEFLKLNPMFLEFRPFSRSRYCQIKIDTLWIFSYIPVILILTINMCEVKIFFQIQWIVSAL